VLCIDIDVEDEYRLDTLIVVCVDLITIPASPRDLVEFVYFIVILHLIPYGHCGGPSLAASRSD
jgi:hypothetical protein